MKRIPLLVKILALVLLVGVGWWVKTRLSSSSSETTYQTATAEKGTLVVSVSASGQTANTNSSSVTTSVSGVVSKVYVKNGDVVHTGDKLAELDLDLSSRQTFLSALASYQSAKNSLESAKTNLYTLQATLFSANQKFINDAAARDLETTDPTYIQEYATWLAAESSYKNQQNVIAQAHAGLTSSWLNYMHSSPIIYAPISGKISGLSLQKGMVINGTSESSQKIATIMTDTLPTVSVNLTDIDVSKVDVGDKVTLTFDALGDKTFIGHVLSVDLSGTTSSNVTSYPVVITLEEANPAILANMSTTAHIITDTKDGVLLAPSSAVKTSNGQTTVQIMKNNQPQTTTVEVGQSSDTQTEIISGVSEGDVVVTSTSTSSTSGTSSTSTTSVFSRTFSGGGAVRIAR